MNTAQARPKKTPDESGVLISILADAQSADAT
jgi:hypothetical protein